MSILTCSKSIFAASSKRTTNVQNTTQRKVASDNKQRCYVMLLSDNVLHNNTNYPKHPNAVRCCHLVVISSSKFSFLSHKNETQTPVTVSHVSFGSFLCHVTSPSCAIVTLDAHNFEIHHVTNTTSATPSTLTN
jgi:hypothetical protein